MSASNLIQKVQKKQFALLSKQSSLGFAQYTMVSPASIQQQRQKLTIQNNKFNGIQQQNFATYSSKQILSRQSSLGQHNFLQNYINRDMQKLSSLIYCKMKSEQMYQSIDQLLCRMQITFFIDLRSYLTKDQYNELIDQCSIIYFTQNKIISKKSHFDQQYFILLDGSISYNEEKIILNTLTGLEEIEYQQISHGQKGQLLNSQTLNQPKHNLYTVLTHSQCVVVAMPASEVYNKLLKKYFMKQLDQKSSSLSNTSLFKGISPQNVKRLLPYFFLKSYKKYNEIIYRQEDKADFVYWIIDGEVQLIKQEEDGNGDASGVGESNNRNSISNYMTSNNNRQRQKQFNNASPINYCNNINKTICKIVKLSKYQIFGIDEYVFKNSSKYLFTARVCSESLKVVCIAYKSLVYIQNSYPCINENIDFYLKRAAAMHSKIVEKNHKIMENKENIRILQKKKKNKKNKKKKKNPTSLQWWGLAQNTVGNKKYKLQLPKFETLKQNPTSSPKSQPMFDNVNTRLAKIEQFRRKIFQQDIDQMIQDEQKNKSVDEDRQSPYKSDYVPKLNKLKVRMLDIKPKAIDTTEKVKKKLISYAKNTGSFCDKLNLD